MQALRQRAACAARQTRPTSAIRNARGYASGHDHHHAAPEVKEGLGASFYVFAGLLPTAAVFYQISRPGADGEPSRPLNKDHVVRNAMRTDALEQAAHDKHLFMNAGPKSPHVELKTPELLNSGSPWNVPAGHYANLDHVTEHYRKAHIADEERKAKKLAEKAAAAQAAAQAAPQAEA
ncbi:NADH dehydrogenase 17.8K chain [Apiospora rasikravindrae]|uniref:NADH dehydrogenase 17.8K chain n=1 Tax=Apiospora rasikravindrae TaxID=990691 RepID=A0ABR1UDM1_9PEZI